MWAREQWWVKGGRREVDGRRGRRQGEGGLCKEMAGGGLRERNRKWGRRESCVCAWHQIGEMSNGIGSGSTCVHF